MKKERKLAIWRILLLLYLALLLYLLFFSKEYGRTEQYNGYRYNLVPFREIRRYSGGGIGSYLFRLNILGNIVAFVPLGFLVPMASKWKRGFLYVAAMTYLASFAVECLQLISRVGIFDLDDIMLNTLGGMLGYILYVLCRIVIHRRKT